MQEKTLLCLGEAWLELTADAVPEQAGEFRVQVGGWGAGFCRAYIRCGGQAALLAQLGRDSFGRKIAAQLAEERVDCSHLCFTDAARTPVVFSGAGESLAFRAPSAELLYAPEQLEMEAFRSAFALCFSSACLLDAPVRLTHLKAVTAARDCGVFVCYAPRMAESAPFWPTETALQETARSFFPQADVLLLKDSDLFPLFGSHELRTALFALFSGHVQLILYRKGDALSVFTRDAMAQAEERCGTDAEFLLRLARLETWPDQLRKLKTAQLQELIRSSSDEC